MFQACLEHHNKIERICLSDDCSSRAMCLLCQHSHGNQFQSIMQKRSESYKVFESKLNEAIDKYFFDVKESDSNKTLKLQLDLIKNYHLDLQTCMTRFLDDIYAQTLKTLQSDEQQTFQMIKSARVNKNYLKVSDKVFKILNQVYEGADFTQLFKNNQTQKSENAFAFCKQFHNSLEQLMSQRGHKLKAKVPDIRSVFVAREEEADLQKIFISYDTTDQSQKSRYQVACLMTTSAQFDSIISDCIKVKDNVLVTSYDKHLRAINRRGMIISDIEYNNILTKIEKIGEDIFAIGKSKQLIIEKIALKEEKALDSVFISKNIMRLTGHQERINDIHSLNTRIIGSSSIEGAKIWDLYKERCEHTFKDESNPSCIRFLPKINNLVIGYNNHLVKIYSIQTLKIIRKYQISGVPLLIDQGKFNDFTFFVGGFPSNLSIIDIRLNKLSFQNDFKSDAITCLTESIFDENLLAFGERSGICKIFDMKTRKVVTSWQAHQGKTNLSKPNGVVKIFEQNQYQYLTAGCNQKNLKLWQISKIKQ